MSSRDQPIYSRPNHLRAFLSRATSNSSCSQLLPLCTLISVLASIALGLIIRTTSTEPWTQRQLMYLEFPGELYIRTLKCLAIPLIIASLVSALANMQPKLVGRIGKRALVYYLATTVIAIVLGVFLVLVLRPGAGKEHVEVDGSKFSGKKITSEDVIMDLLRNMIPVNLFGSFTSLEGTKLSPPSNFPNETDVSKWSITVSSVSGTNILGLVFVSIVVGLFTEALHRQHNQPLLRALSNDVTNLLINISTRVLWTTPIGVFFLIMPRIIGVDHVEVVFTQCGRFAFTVLLGLFMHGFLILPLIYYLFTKRNPYRFIMDISESLLTAFGTASSVATLPSTIKCLEERVKVNRNVARFMAPLGATVNMDGTALYEAVVAIFIAQMRSSVGMDLARVLAVSITTTVASIGTAGIPQAGIVTMAMILSSLNLPPEDLVLVIAIDFLLHRFRTAINVLGDAYGAALINHLSQKDIATFEALDAAAASIQKFVDPIDECEKQQQQNVPEIPEPQNIHQKSLTLNLSNNFRQYQNVPPEPREYESEKITAISFSRLQSN